MGAGVREYLVEHFLPDMTDVDVVVGYRADDSYFSFAEDFVNNTISIRDLNVAMQLDSWGSKWCFYLSALSITFLLRVMKWQTIANITLSGRNATNRLEKN